MTVVHGSRPPAPALVRTDPGALEQLVTAAAEAEPTAVNALLRVLEPIAVRYCRARLDHTGLSGGPGLSADDVAQEVCVAVLHALPRHTDRGDSLLSFVYTVASARVDDVLRLPAYRRPARDAGPGVSEQDRLVSAIAALPREHREILILRIAVGFDASDTADALALTPAAVRVRQHAALDRLRGTHRISPAEPVRGHALGR